MRARLGRGLRGQRALEQRARIGASPAAASQSAYASHEAGLAEEVARPSSKMLRGTLSARSPAHSISAAAA